MLGQPRVDSPAGLLERGLMAARTLGLLKPPPFLGSRRARAREPLTRLGLESSKSGLCEGLRALAAGALEGVRVLEG
eukprot:5497514-Alexandrium_andersonii.AAC.1